MATYEYSMPDVNGQCGGNNKNDISNFPVPPTEPEPEPEDTPIAGATQAIANSNQAVIDGWDSACKNMTTEECDKQEECTKKDDGTCGVDVDQITFQLSRQHDDDEINNAKLRKIERVSSNAWINASLEADHADGDGETKHPVPDENDPDLATTSKKASTLEKVVANLIGSDSIIRKGLKHNTNHFIRRADTDELVGVNNEDTNTEERSREDDKGNTLPVYKRILESKNDDTTEEAVQKPTAPAPAPAPKSVPCWEKPRGTCQKGEYLKKGPWWTWRNSCELCIPENISENLYNKLQQYKKTKTHSVQELDELVQALTKEIEISQGGGSYEQTGGHLTGGETKDNTEDIQAEDDAAAQKAKEDELILAKTLKDGTVKGLKELLEKVEHDLKDAAEKSENKRIEVLKDYRSRFLEELTKANAASASASAALRAAEAASAARKSAKNVAQYAVVQNPKALSYFHNSKNIAKKQITVQRDNGLLSTDQKKQVHTMSNSFTEGYYFFESDIQDIQGRTLTSKLGVKGLVTVTPQWIGYSPQSTSDSIATFSDIDKMAKQLYNNYSTGIGEKRELMVMMRDIRSHLETYFHKARKFEKRTLLNEIDNGQVNVYIPFGYEGSLIVFSWMRKSTSDTHYYAYPVHKWQVLETEVLETTPDAQPQSTPTVPNTSNVSPTPKKVDDRRDVSFSPRNNMRRYEERMPRMPGRRGYEERDNYDRSPRRGYTDRSLGQRGYEERDNYDTMRDSREYSDPPNDTPFSGDTPRMYDEMKTSREEGDDLPQSMSNYNIDDMMENRLEDDLPEGHSDSEGNEELQGDGETKEWGVGSTDDNAFDELVGESKEEVGELQDLMQSNNDEAGENGEELDEEKEEIFSDEAGETMEDREALEDLEDLEDQEDDTEKDENMLFADSEDTHEEQLTDVGQEQSTVNVHETHSDPLPNPPPLRSTDIIHRHYHYTPSLPTQHCPQPVANEQSSRMTMRDCNVEVNSGYSALDSFVTWLCEDPTKQ
jgi:hypothetical protein